MKIPVKIELSTRARTSNPPAPVTVTGFKVDPRFSAKNWYQINTNHQLRYNYECAGRVERFRLYDTATMPNGDKLTVLGITNHGSNKVLLNLGV